MKEIDKGYWDEYYQFWDWFVQEWFKRRENNPTSRRCGNYDYEDLARSFKAAVNDLNFNELPNPYFGDPKNGVEAVIINLNPGGSEIDENRAGTDATQFYSNLKDTDKKHGKGWLMWKFVDDAKCSYKRFVGNDDESVNWSQLNPSLRGHKPEVCGVKWWQGSNPRQIGGKMGWIRRIYGNDLCPSKVFALELCPYHSKNFKVSATLGLKEFIKDWVVSPAVHAVAENRKLDFALAVGGMNDDGKGTMVDIMNAICGEPEMVWSFENPSCVESCKWPLNSKGEPTRRKYVLFRGDVNGACARILVTMMQGGNKMPGKDFEDVEKDVRAYCKVHPL